MKVVGLVSGGKDSTFNLMKCIEFGHEIVCLANLKPLDPNVDELDSFMYQSVGHEAIEALAECLELPLYRIGTKGESVQKSLHYDSKKIDSSDEVEALYYLLRFVQKSHPEIQAVSCGAILSNYQRYRVESVCLRLGLTCLAFLWQRDQSELLHEMIESNMEAILIKVAGFGLNPKRHLGKSLKDLENELLQLNKTCQINVCGEGGEYESLTLDCPIFKKKLIIEETELIIVNDNEWAPVGYLRCKKISILPKSSSSSFIPQIIIVDFEKENLNPYHFPDLSIQNEMNSFLSKNEMNSFLSKNEMNSFLSKNEMNYPWKHIYCWKDEWKDLTLEEQMIKQMEQTLPLRETICYVCVYVRSISNFGALNQIYAKFFLSNPPSRTLIQANLPKGHEVRVEFLSTSQPRNVLHVASISSWAPACIGPYSQCNTVEGFLFLAGQIPLFASTMTLSNEPMEKQLHLLLHNLQNLLKVLSSSNSRVFYCNVFLIQLEFHSLVEKILGSAFHSKIHFNFIQVEALPRSALIEIQPFAFDQSHDEKEFQIIQKNGISLFGFSSLCGPGMILLETLYEIPSSQLDFLQRVFFCSKDPPSFPSHVTLIPVSKLMNNSLYLLEFLFPI